MRFSFLSGEQHAFLFGCVIVDFGYRACDFRSWVGNSMRFSVGVFLLILGSVRAIFVPEWGTARVSLWVCYF